MRRLREGDERSSLTPGRRRTPPAGIMTGCEELADRWGPVARLKARPGAVRRTAANKPGRVVRVARREAPRVRQWTRALTKGCAYSARHPLSFEGDGKGDYGAPGRQDYGR
jgi:hypothetical protein